MPNVRVAGAATVRERGCARGGADRSLTLAAPEIRGPGRVRNPSVRRSR
jgi:hypothetical protein